MERRNRLSALKAMELLTQIEEANSDADSDADPEDWSDESFLLDDSDSKSVDSDTGIDPECPETSNDNNEIIHDDPAVVSGQSKASTVKWSKMNIGDHTKYLHGVDLHVQYAGPTRRARNLVDDSFLSAFLAIIDKTTLDNIVLFTNEEVSRLKKNTFSRNDILASIAVLFCRGLYCRGMPIKDLWSKQWGTAMIGWLCSRDKFTDVMRCTIRQ